MSIFQADIELTIHMLIPQIKLHTIITAVWPDKTKVFIIFGQKMKKNFNSEIVT